jgi:hypothetical protein
VYETINISPERAIQFVKQLHNEDYKKNTGKLNYKTLNSNVKRDVGKPTSEFLKLCDDEIVSNWNISHRTSYSVILSIIICRV